ncbi:MAG: anthranilate synthase component II, partial [Angustibacter sp.]
GHPAKAMDVGLNYDLLRTVSCPILGVCLGHQMLAHYRGATVAAIPPAHGEISRIRHNGDPIFANIPAEFNVVRYHSLAVTQPGEFQIIARSAGDGHIMAIAHPVRPWIGVQFHPESICSEFGEQLLRNFLSRSVNS